MRLLDYLDLHYYPQASGVSLSGAGDAATQARRLRSTRVAVGSRRYVDESWINEAVRLIPRMRDWVAQYYPGTKLAIGEYNWGALDHINGALAQADVLGIFGREGLDLATLWAPPTASQPGAFAFRMYRNYDGAGGALRRRRRHRHLGRPGHGGRLRRAAQRRRRADHHGDQQDRAAADHRPHGRGIRRDGRRRASTATLPTNLAAIERLS